MKNIICAAAILCSCSVVKAETLPVAGVYASGTGMDAEIHTIAVEGFGGDAGPELSFLFTDLLAEVEIHGKNWFSIVPAATLSNHLLGIGHIQAGDGDGAARVEDQLSTVAVLSGTARSQVNDYSISPKKVKTCAKKVAKKCVERVVEVYECRNMTVGYTASLRIVAPNGDLLYQNSNYLEAAQSYCEDEDRIPDADQMLGSLAAQYSYAARLDLAPQYRETKFRILERRNGLSKDDARSFKDAIRLTKTDPLGACSAFGGLEASNPNQLSVLFNIGLCREGKGDLTAAREYYLRALSVEPRRSVAQAGLARIESRIQAERQVMDHFDLN